MKNTIKNTYNIQLASKISGVGVHTIRAWEKRYKAVVPGRTSNGRREYNDEDIERLSLLNDLCIIGHTIGKIAFLSTKELKDLLRKLGNSSKENDRGIKFFRENQSNIKDQNIDDSLSSLLLALSVYKLDIINHEISKLKLLLSSKDLAMKIILPLIRSVGIKVSLGEFSISQEHALSSILKFHIGHALYQSSSQRSSKSNKVIICAPEGDYHEFGIMIGALLCCHYQIDFYYLGPNLPADSLIDAYNGLEATNIIIGSTVIPEGKDDKVLHYFLDSVSRRIKNGKIHVGGGEHIHKYKHKNYLNTDFFNSIDELDKFLSSL